MQYKDYYKIMSLARDASQEDVKRAYRKLARKYHPDVSKEADAEERFKEINEAYEVLKDPQKRQAYDQLGTGWRAGQEFTPPPGWDTAFDVSSFGDMGSGRFSDFFETLFGMGGRSDWRTAGRSKTPAGRDQRASVTITLEDAYHGATRTVNLQGTRTDRSGRVVGGTRTLKVRIPQGVTQGQQIRLAGQGTGGGARPGNLYLQVSFQPHPLYRLEGRDVHLRLPVAPWEVALGATVTVPTLGGKVDLTVPPGSQSGQKLRLRGRGLPGRPPGDQYVELRVVTPKADTDAKKALFEQMRQEMAFDPRAQIGV